VRHHSATQPEVHTPLGPPHLNSCQLSCLSEAQGQCSQHTGLFQVGVGVPASASSPHLVSARVSGSVDGRARRLTFFA